MNEKREAADIITAAAAEAQLAEIMRKVADELKAMRREHPELPPNAAPIFAAMTEVCNAIIHREPQRIREAAALRSVAVILRMGFKW